eukprot:gene1822-33241_t
MLRDQTSELVFKDVHFGQGHFFDQKFHATFFLAPDAQESAPSRGLPPPRNLQRSSTSPREDQAYLQGCRELTRTRSQGGGLSKSVSFAFPLEVPGKPGRSTPTSPTGGQAASSSVFVDRAAPLKHSISGQAASSSVFVDRAVPLKHSISATAQGGRSGSPPAAMRGALRDALAQMLPPKFASDKNEGEKSDSTGASRSEGVGRDRGNHTGGSSFGGGAWGSSSFGVVAGGNSLGLTAVQPLIPPRGLVSQPRSRSPSPSRNQANSSSPRHASQTLGRTSPRHSAGSPRRSLSPHPMRSAGADISPRRAGRSISPDQLPLPRKVLPLKPLVLPRPSSPSRMRGAAAAGTGYSALDSGTGHVGGLGISRPARRYSSPSGDGGMVRSSSPCEANSSYKHSTAASLSKRSSGPVTVDFRPPSMPASSASRQVPSPVKPRPTRPTHAVEEGGVGDYQLERLLPGLGRGSGQDAEEGGDESECILESERRLLGMDKLRSSILALNEVADRSRSTSPRSRGISPHLSDSRHSSVGRGSRSPSPTLRSTRRVSSASHSRQPYVPSVVKTARPASPARERSTSPAMADVLTALERLQTPRHSSPTSSRYTAHSSAAAGGSGLGRNEVCSVRSPDHADGGGCSGSALSRSEVCRVRSPDRAAASGNGLGWNEASSVRFPGYAAAAVSAGGGSSALGRSEVHRAMSPNPISRSLSPSRTAQISASTHAVRAAFEGKAIDASKASLALTQQRQAQALSHMGHLLAGGGNTEPAYHLAARADSGLEAAAAAKVLAAAAAAVLESPLGGEYSDSRPASPRALAVFTRRPSSLVDDESVSSHSSASLSPLAHGLSPRSSSAEFSFQPSRTSSPLRPTAPESTQPASNPTAHTSTSPPPIRDESPVRSYPSRTAPSYPSCTASSLDTGLGAHPGRRVSGPTQTATTTSQRAMQRRATPARSSSAGRTRSSGAGRETVGSGGRGGGGGGGMGAADHVAAVAGASEAIARRSAATAAAMHAHLRSKEAQADFDALRERMEVERAELRARLEAANRREEALNAQINGHLSSLGDKDKLVATLQERLRGAARTKKELEEQVASTLTRTSPFRGASSCGGSSGPMSALAGSKSLEEINAELTSKVKDLEEQVKHNRDDMTRLRRMQLELQARHPDVGRVMATAVQQEQASQEERNRRALEMLLSKDTALKAVEAKAANFERQFKSLENQHKEITERLEHAEIHVVTLLERQDETHAGMDEERRKWASTLASLESELIQHKTSSAAVASAEDRAGRAHDNILDVTKQLRKRSQEVTMLQEEAADLMDKLQSAEGKVAELEIVKRKSDAQHSKRVQTLMSGHAVEVAALQRQTLMSGHAAEVAALQRQVSRWEKRKSDAQHTERVQTLLTGHAAGVAALQRQVDNLTKILEAWRKGSGSKAPDVTVDNLTKILEVGRKGSGSKAPHATVDDLTKILEARSKGSGTKAPDVSVNSNAHRAAAVSEAACAELRVRVRTLEEKNEQLEGAVEEARKQKLQDFRALEAVGGDASIMERVERDRLTHLLAERERELAELRSEQVERDRLTHLLAERERELAELRSEQSVSSARERLGGVKDSSHTPAGLVRELQRQMADREFQIGMLQEKVAMLETQCAVHKCLAEGQRQMADRESQISMLQEKVAMLETQCAVHKCLAEGQRQMAGRESQISMLQEKVAMLETQCAVHKCLAEGQEGNKDGAERHRLGNDAELARATAAHLNARVNELVAREQAATSEIESLHKRLSHSQELHQRDCEAMEQRHQEVLQKLNEAATSGTAQVKELIASAPQLKAPTADHSRVLSQPTVALRVELHKRSLKEAATREGQLEQAVEAAETAVAVVQSRLAVEAAETAVAVVQSRLIDALKARSDLSAQMLLLKRDHETECSRLESELRSAREDGTIRLRNLEDALQRAGARGGETGLELSRALAESDAARRSETRLKAEVALERDLLLSAEQRYNEAVQQMTVKEAEVDEYWVYWLSAVPAGLQPELAPGLESGGGQDEKGGAFRIHGASHTTTVGLAPLQHSDLERQDQHGSGTMRVVSRSPLVSPTRDVKSGKGTGPPWASPLMDARRARPEGKGEGSGNGVPKNGVGFGVLDAKLERQLRIQVAELARRQQTIARLVERADKAEEDAAATRAELERMRESLPQGNDPLLEVQKRLGMREVEAKAAKEQVELQSIEMKKISAELDVGHLTQSLDKSNRLRSAAEEEAARRAVQVSGAMSLEASEFSKRAAEAELASKMATAAQREAFEAESDPSLLLTH